MNTSFETKHGKIAGTDVWLTPIEIIKGLGEFDLDPCFSEPRPWDTAKKHYGEAENGLVQPWEGFVWCNPPYGEKTKEWLKRCCEHKACIALIFARTETKMFKDYIWNKAKGVFFFYGRLRFSDLNGKLSDNSAGAPSCLVCWDDEGIVRLKNYEKTGKGKFVLLNN